jgi:hypothetical protein
MATQYAMLTPGGASFPTATFPGRKTFQGTSFPVETLAFDSAANEAAFWKVSGANYGSGTYSVDLHFYADTATTGDTKWDVAFAAITPDVDTQDVETKALNTATTGTKTHPGTVGQRLQKLSITGVSADSAAVGDAIWIRIRRLGADAADTMTGDALLVHAYVSYSDV